MRIACMRNVYVGMPRSGRSPSKVVSCTFLLHELPAWTASTKYSFCTKYIQFDLWLSPFHKLLCFYFLFYSAHINLAISKLYGIQTVFHALVFFISSQPCDYIPINKYAIVYFFQVTCLSSYRAIFLYSLFQYFSYSLSFCSFSFLR